MYIFENEDESKWKQSGQHLSPQNSRRSSAARSVLSPLTDKQASWIYDSIHVFDGDFTVAEDRVKLVDTVLGLYAHALIQHAVEKADGISSTVHAQKEGADGLKLSRDDSNDEIKKGKAGEVNIFEMIQQHKESVFPEKYFTNLICLLEETMASSGLNEEWARRMVVQSSCLPVELSSMEKKTAPVQYGSSLQDLFKSGADIKHMAVDSAAAEKYSFVPPDEMPGATVLPQPAASNLFA